jgi:hypothetical protein
MRRCVDEPNSPLSKKSKNQCQKGPFKTFTSGALYFCFVPLASSVEYLRLARSQDLVLKISLIVFIISLNDELILVFKANESHDTSFSN